MNYIFLGAAVLSFVLSYFVGKRIKSFWSLLAAPIVGILVSIPTFLIFMRFAELERFGLGVIAIVPLLLIFIPLFNVTASLLGVLTGVLHAKRKR